MACKNEEFQTDPGETKEDQQYKTENPVDNDSVITLTTLEKDLPLEQYTDPLVLEQGFEESIDETSVTNLQGQLSTQNDESIDNYSSIDSVTKEHQLSEQKDELIIVSSSSDSLSIRQKNLNGKDQIGSMMHEDSVTINTTTEISPTNQCGEQSEQSITCFSSSAPPTFNELQSNLFSIGLKQSDIDFIFDQGEKFLEKPVILAKKLKVSQEKAKAIISALKNYKQKPVIILIPDDIKKIEKCIKENPEIDSQEDIALLCDIDEGIVSAYFESKPLNENQKAAIKEKYNDGYKIADIVNILKLSNQKVQTYVESTFLTFTSEEGKKTLGIIQENFPEIKFTKLREMVISNNLKLQDQLCCILLELNDTQYMIVKKYFSKFAESKSFYKVDTNLTIDDILRIKQSSFENIEQLSIKLNKVETVISDYLKQYSPNDVVRKHHTNKQVDQIHKIVTNFGKDQLSFQTYRMIISESFEAMIKNATKNEQKPKDAFLQLLPLSFYYLKCSLPLEDITQMIANSSKITLTTHDVFHIIFQLSDPVLRGFCIEHYSFSNPVPFYYPLLKSSSTSKKKKNIFRFAKSYGIPCNLSMGLFPLD